MNKLLTNRNMSGFPVSIGTGLSLESIFTPIAPVYDETREIPNKVDTKQYNLFIFNISTLLRNLINSVENNRIFDIDRKDIYKILIEEIEFLDYFFNLNGLDIKFYINTYEIPKQKYKDDLRTPNTSKQILLANLSNYILTTYIKNNNLKPFKDKVIFGKEFKALMFTHIPWDLLSYSKYIKLDLLESNTGIVKPRRLFNTKYFKVPRNDMSFLPFSAKLLSIFGDRVMFKPRPLKERIQLYDLLASKHVHPLTSDVVLETIGIK